MQSQRTCNYYGTRAAMCWGDRQATGWRACALQHHSRNAYARQRLPAIGPPAHTPQQKICANLSSCTVCTSVRYIHTQ